MHLKWMPWIAAAACWFSGLEARAADVAVLPVQGVGLSPGDAEAIGALFARAVARDAHVVVASPQETKPLLDAGATAGAVATELGASNYIELIAERARRAVKLSGALFGLDGTSLYRAETFGPSLDEMDVAISALAQALIWRKPVANLPAMQGGLPPMPTEGESPGRSPSGYRGAHGPKLGLVMPRASGTTFLPSFTIQYDGRFGPPSYFVELGAGLVIPFDDNPTDDSVSVAAGYLEIGASRYLWAGDVVAPYLGAGVSPALWATHAYGRSDVSATCLAYAQLGMELGRAGRARFFGEVRLSQTLLAVTHLVSDGTTYGAVPGEPHRPLLIAFQGGVGW